MDHSTNEIEPTDHDESATPTAAGTTPEYYKQTARAYGHALTAIEGRLHALVWRCRVCTESRATAEAFQGVACDG